MKTNSSGGNKRIASNAIALYLKMMYTIAVALFTTRIVLSALGAADYGIYTLVAGVVALLTFLNVSMTVATQRFMSIAMGQGDKAKVKKIFETSVCLHLLIGFLVVIGLEIASPFLFNGFLNIASSRIYEAKIVYQLMIVSPFFTINAVPYDAAINANEEMWVDSILGGVENTLKLGIAIFLIYTTSDKLVMYSLLTAGVIIIARIIKSFYCRKRYHECKISRMPWKGVDMSLVKEMGAFAGWNTIGALVFVGRNQLISVILNLFYGTVINAAYGIANQINAQVAAFSSTLLKAINPQIAKSEGAGDRKRMLQMADYSTKLSFFIFVLILVPLFVEMPYALGLWLKNVPEFAVIFCRLLLFSTLLMQLSNGLMLSIQSLGNLKSYTLLVNSIYALNIPIAYIILHFGFKPYSVVGSMIVIEIVALLTRSIVASRLIIEFDLLYFLKNVVFKLVILVLLVLLITYYLGESLDTGLFRLSLVTMVSGCLSIVLFYLFVMNSSERDKIKTIILKKIGK